MVAVGGVTRLTRSGLSIVEWKPITGFLPPIGDAAWQAEFAKYQASPEYLKVNTHLSLEGYRQIFYVEWFHRLLGRLTGFVVAVPLAWFVWRRQISRKLAMRLLLLVGIGGLQGALGWFMVKSGLQNEPHVSPYRLTAHLLLALALFVSLLYTTCDEAFARPPSTQRPALLPLRRAALALGALLGITITWGGLMAGFKAGLVAPTFPTMNSYFIPVHMFPESPAILNFVSNPLTIHFTHRLLAYCTFTGVLAIAIAVLRSSATPARARRLAAALLGLAGAQVMLGAIVVLSFVNTGWASLHQVNAVLLLGVLVALVHQLSPAAAPSSSAAPH